MRPLAVEQSNTSVVFDDAVDPQGLPARPRRAQPRRRGRRRPGHGRLRAHRQAGRHVAARRARPRRRPRVPRRRRRRLAPRPDVAARPVRPALPARGVRAATSAPRPAGWARPPAQLHVALAEAFGRRPADAGARGPTPCTPGSIDAPDVPRGRRRLRRPALARRRRRRHPHPRRPPPRPGAAHRRRLVRPRLRGRAPDPDQRAAQAVVAAARRRRDAALVPLRRRGRAARAPRAGRRRAAPRSPTRWVERNRGAFLGGYLGTEGVDELLPKRRGRAQRRARRLRAGQGRLRGRLRARAPPRLGAHPEVRHREVAWYEQRAHVEAPVRRARSSVVEGNHANPHQVLGRHGDVVRLWQPGADVDRRLDVGLRRRRGRAGAPRRAVRGDVPRGGGHAVHASSSPGPTARRRRRCTTRTGSCRRSATSTCTSSARARTASCGRRSAPGRWCTTACGARASPCGRRRRAPCASSATGTAGTAGPTRCARSAASGVWELFLPDVGSGARYKFEVVGADGVVRLKADPFARWSEEPPGTASVVFESHARVERRRVVPERGCSATPRRRSAVSVYECHLGSWLRSPDDPDRWLSWDDLAAQARRPRRATSASPTSSCCR